MKDLLITHTDLDGISPIILMNLTKEKVWIQINRY